MNHLALPPVWGKMCSVDEKILKIFLEGVTEGWMNLQPVFFVR